MELRNPACFGTRGFSWRFAESYLFPSVCWLGHWSDCHACATPENWQPGEQVIVPPPATVDAASTGLNEKMLSKMDIDYDWAQIIPKDKVGIMPDAEYLIFKLLFEKPTGRILGAQAMFRISGL